jgi:[CysO sulfur-carrier protein]-S-L-cysteine hydrolase
MKISAALLEQIVEHALSDSGNEVCGVVAVTGGDVHDGGAERTATSVHRATNVHASPMKFEIEPRELLALYTAIEDRGDELGAIYHSHVRSRPYPSQTDVNFAANWPGVEWIIVGLSPGAEPEVRSYLIEGGKIEEVPIGAQGN